jgi:hypothetical protein
MQRFSEPPSYSERHVDSIEALLFEQPYGFVDRRAQFQRGQAYLTSSASPSS